MKKEFLVMALAGVALVGCVSDEVSDISQKNEAVKIKFNTPVVAENAHSRANYKGEIGEHQYDAGQSPFPGTYVYPQEENFMVGAKIYTDTDFKWSTAVNFWEDEDGDLVEFLPVFWQGNDVDHPVNGWKTKDDFYWPTGKSLAFVAYSPAEIPGNPTVTYPNDGFAISSFSVDDTPSNQVDLLCSELMTGLTANNTFGGYYGAPINFHHILSSVHFAVEKPSTIDAKIELKSITLKNVKKTGSYANRAWNTTGSTTVSYVPYSKTSDLLEFGSNQSSHVGKNGGQALLLMPQTLESVLLDVEYYVDGNYKKAENISIDGLEGIDKNAEKLTIDEWKPGNKYIYVLKYAAMAKDIIYFSPVLKDWEVWNVGISLD